MPRVIGIDPGTVSVDLCGLDDGRLFLDRSWPTAEALADPAGFVAQLEAAGPLDLIAGPSGYGLPLTRVQDATEEDLRLAFLASPGETGGIGGLRNLVRALARTALPVMLTPGVVHLPTVPAHRKVNRVDMGTAEKVCAAALAVSEQARRADGGSAPANVSFVLLELGGAFTAANHQGAAGRRFGRQEARVDQSLVVDELVTLAGLDAPVEHQGLAVGGRLEDFDVLELGLGLDQRPGDGVHMPFERRRGLEEPLVRLRVDQLTGTGALLLIGTAELRNIPRCISTIEVRSAANCSTR